MSVVVTDVQATSPRLEQGDAATVRGRFRLESHKDAQLALYLTQTEGDGVEEVDPDQTMHVSGLRGQFELKTTIAHRGVLHESFYDLQSGEGFGGVYFGTPEQIKAIEHWDWANYGQDDSRRSPR